MKAFILTLALLCVTNMSVAQDKIVGKEVDQKLEHIKMHENMIKAHQEAAECLRSGKSEDECRKAFHEMCRENGGPDKCGGPWMMHHKMGRKNK